MMAVHMTRDTAFTKQRGEKHGPAFRHKGRDYQDDIEMAPS